MVKDYLLEIGVEELPSRFVDMALVQLKDKFIKLLDDSRLEYEEVVVEATPRRLVAFVKALSDVQEDVKATVKGPNAKIAYDEDGNPTKALQGFMKSQGVDVSKLTVRDDYVYADIERAGQSIDEIFADAVPNLIKSINFPNNMRWGGKAIKFARPIRWLVSVYGDRIVEFNLEGIIASNVTRGHRFLGSSNIVVDDVANYESLLKENYVILKAEDRLEIIKFGSEKLAREVGGEIRPSDDLLTELKYIVEYPTPIMGRIKEEYLTLPNDLITTPMREHLRFIPVYKNREQLLPYFITIRNGDEQYKDIVISGNEKVLAPRLEDAKFFYREDLKIPLESLVPSLDGIVFHDKLGTLSEKTHRLERMGIKLGEYLEVADETIEAVERAAYLSKADLLTKVVSEFTELQGKMGMIYAEHDGEDKLVAKAIFEQYLPRFSGDELPETTAGSIISIADKIDTIAGLFAIEIVPTGSQDQFAQRRAALGIINIILDNQWNLSLSGIIEDALYNYIDENDLVFDYEESKKKIKEFFLSRLKTILSDKKIRYDIIDATISADNDNILKIISKAEKLNDWFAAADRRAYVDAFTRVKNIAVKAETNQFSEEAFGEEEKALYAEFVNVRAKVDEIYSKDEYEEILDLLGDLIDPINEYFDKVMILVDDEEVRNNRLGLLRQISDYVLGIFDFSKIVQ